MRFLVDDVIFQYTPSGGVARFWRSTLEFLKAHPLVSGIDVVSRTGMIDKFANVTFPFAKMNSNWANHDRSNLDLLTASGNYSAFISTHYTLSTKSPNITVVHDLIPEVLGFDRVDTGWLQRKLALLSSDVILSVSQNTSKDFQLYYPSATGRVSQLKLEVDERIFSPAGTDRVGKVLARKGIESSNYVIMVGLEESYKNTAKVLKLFQDHDFGFDLVVIKHDAAQTREIPGKSKIFLTSCDDNDLAVLYSGAAAALYPSDYEGFGFVAREAIRSGTRLVAQNKSSIPESSEGQAIELLEVSAKGLALALTKLTASPKPQLHVPFGSFERVYIENAEVFVSAAERLDAGVGRFGTWSQGEGRDAIREAIGAEARLHALPV
jgi:glycosyltransferase involved in cell wall biosynthesis